VHTSLPSWAALCGFLDLDTPLSVFTLMARQVGVALSRSQVAP
jgi:hypothetical protein